VSGLRIDDRLVNWILGRERLKKRLEARYGGQLRNFLDEGAHAAFNECSEPELSVIVPVHNSAHHTLRCLLSIMPDTSVPFEVIVCDDASNDQTTELLGRFENIRILRNEANLGFIGTVNRAGALARGMYLLLMNNDAALIEGKLRSALDVFERRADVGAVGVRIRYATGRLQEAGGMIFSDGKTDGYLWNETANDKRADVERDVDYCSGAFLFLRTHQFHDLGGLDITYAPAYYEESDYCMKLRQRGFATVYTPSIVVEHFEFGSQSTAVAWAALERNREIFKQRWQDVLKPPEFLPSDTDLDGYAHRLGTARDMD
jgi:O-antigen biosynthesis protein